MENFTLEPEAQERISVEELARLILKILKLNLSTPRRVGYYPGRLSAIKAVELLQYPGGRQVKIPNFDRKFAQAVHLLKKEDRIMQDHEYPHDQDCVQLTHKEEAIEPDQFLPFVESSDQIISKLNSSVGAIDPVIEIYLREALETFKSNFLISSAFCLGAMSERCILLLAKGIKDDLNEPSVSSVYSRCRSVKHYADFISDNLSKLRSKNPGNDDLFRELDVKINTLSTYYRLTRNEAGHPAFVPNITRPTLESHLRTAPEYLDTMLGVLKLL